MHYILSVLCACRNALAKFLHVLELMGSSVLDIVTKPRTSVSGRVPEGFFVGYLDISVRSSFPQRYSLRTNENIWSLLPLSSSGSLLLRRGIIDTAKTCSREGEDNTSHNERSLPKVLRTTRRFAWYSFHSKATPPRSRGS